MTSTRTMGRDGTTLRVLGWDGSSLGAGTLGGADPLGFAAGDANLYRYVGNDPTNEVDPTGLQGSLIDTTKYPNPVSFTLSNPQQTMVLIGPPHKGATNDPHQYVGTYFKKKDVPDANIINYKNMEDLKKQLSACPQLKKGRFDVVVWNHGKPGAIAVQYDPTRVGVSTEDPASLKNFKDFSNILYGLNPYNLWITGCSTYSYVNGTGPNDSMPFFKYLQDELPGDTFLCGSKGSFSTGPSSDDSNAPLGIYIENGGRLQVPIIPLLPKR